MLSLIASPRPSGEPSSCGPRRSAGSRSRTALLSAAVAVLLPLGGLTALAPGDARAQSEQPIPPALQQPLPVQPGQPPAQQQPGQQQQAPQAQPSAPANPGLRGEVHGDWIKRCTTDPPTEASPPAPGKQEVCFLIQEVMDQETRRPLLKVTIGFFGAEREPRAVIAMPLGVFLTNDLQINVDGKEVGTVPFDVCRPDGCLANILLDDSVIGAFKAGSQGQARVESNQGKVVNLPISLKGFTAGYTAIQ